jgi:plasmid stabilization system protein ParE
VSRYRVVIQPRARIDTIEGFNWIAERSEDAAIRWYAGLQGAIAKLAKNPERHPVAAEESERFGITIRESLDGRRRGVYRILYSIEQDTISVLAIRHSARGLIEP